MTSSGIFVTDRSSHQRCSIKELFLEIWQYSQKKKLLCSSVFLMKLLALFSRIRIEYGEILRISPYSVQMRENEACNFIKKTLKQRCFSVNTGKFFKTPVLKNTWLLLYWYTFVTAMSFLFSGNMCLFVLSWRHLNYVIKQVI